MAPAENDGERKANMQAAAGKNFLTLMAKMARDKDTADFTLVCEGARRPTHSFILRNF